MAIAQTHGWQLAEGSAAAYERYLVPVFMDPWAADLIDAVEVAPGQRVLDIACGTGVVTRRAAARVGSGGEVTAVDVNPGMLAVARAAAAGMPAPIRWHEAGAEQLPLADASIDVVLCQQGLQFFYDPAAALAEMRRVARPGGRLGVSTCRSIAHQPGYAALIDALTRHLGADAGTALRSPYALGDADELRALVRQAGFTAIDVRIAVWSARFSSAEALLRAETASSPLGEVVSQLDPDVQDALIRDATDALTPHTDDHGVVFPFETAVLTAAPGAPRHHAQGGTR